MTMYLTSFHPRYRTIISSRSLCRWRSGEMDSELEVDKENIPANIPPSHGRKGKHTPRSKDPKTSQAPSVQATLVAANAAKAHAPPPCETTTSSTTISQASTTMLRPATHHPSKATPTQIPLHTFFPQNEHLPSMPSLYCFLNSCTWSQGTLILFNQAAKALTAGHHVLWMTTKSHDPIPPLPAGLTRLIRQATSTSASAHLPSAQAMVGSFRVRQVTSLELLPFDLIAATCPPPPSASSLQQFAAPSTIVIPELDELLRPVLSSVASGGVLREGSVASLLARLFAQLAHVSTICLNVAATRTVELARARHLAHACTHAEVLAIDCGAPFGVVLGCGSTLVDSTGVYGPALSEITTRVLARFAKQVLHIKESTQQQQQQPDVPFLAREVTLEDVTHHTKFASVRSGVVSALIL